jgi:outer membrane protein assembly factor BamB
MRDRWFAGALVVPFVLGIASAPTNPGTEAFTFRDPEIVESSGIALVDGLVVTTNDSGDTGRVFTVDPDTGETVGMTQWEEDPEDVEALAPGGDGAVWVADIGDNSESRDSIEVTRVPVGRGDRTVDEETYDLVYPDGAQNAETLLADPDGRLYVATKSVFGGTLYAAPRTLAADDPNRLQELGSVLPIATDGAFFPDGGHLVVRDYSRAAVYSFPGLEEVGSFRLPEQEQGEGIVVDDGGSLLVTSEGQFAPVLRVPLPSDVRRAMRAGAGAPSSSSAPSSSAGTSSSASESASASASPSAGSTAGDEAAESEQSERAWWPWLLTAGVVLGGLAVLVRSLRPR